MIYGILLCLGNRFQEPIYRLRILWTKSSLPAISSIGCLAALRWPDYHIVTQFINIDVIDHSSIDATIL